MPRLAPVMECDFTCELCLFVHRSSARRHKPSLNILSCGGNVQLTRRHSPTDLALAWKQTFSYNPRVYFHDSSVILQEYDFESIRRPKRAPGGRKVNTRNTLNKD